jgi:YidC/Oxa1 family membrane protein insertase
MPSEFAADTSGGLVSERVTTATPELAPAGIDKAAVVDGAGATQSATQSGHSSVEALVDDIIQNPQGPVSEYMGDPTTAIDRIGALKSMGLDFGWGPTATFEWLIEHVYIMSPYGWGASIIASTVILRTCLFYFQMQGSDNMAKMATLNPITKDYTNQMREASNAGDQEKMQFYKSRLSALYKEAGVRPIVGMLPMFWQMIFGFGAWRCIRNMSWLPVPGMDQGGWLWFQNLAVADPYYLVPALGAGLVYVTVRVRLPSPSPFLGQQHYAECHC